MSVCLSLAATPLAAQGTTAFTTGVRLGISSTETSIHQSEVFLNRDLRLLWKVGANVSIRPRLEFTSGLITRDDEYAYVVTIGPAVVAWHSRLPVFVNAGTRPTFLSKSAFGDHDLGVRFQITSHVGVDWRARSRAGLGYRVQHTSNAGLAEHNPGLNMHFVSVTFRF
jgi:hypothetical protein